MLQNSAAYMLNKESNLCNAKSFLKQILFTLGLLLNKVYRFYSHEAPGENFNSVKVMIK